MHFQRIRRLRNGHAKSLVRLQIAGALEQLRDVLVRSAVLAEQGIEHVRASIPFELEAITETLTAVTYRVELAVSGRLASFGAPLLRDTMRRQVAALVANLEREVAEAMARGSPADTRDA